MTTEAAEKLEEIVGEDPILGIVNRTLPTREGADRKYYDVKPFTEGGTRKIYTANWGPKGKKVVIKVDKEPKSPRAMRHVQRGYNTGRELEIASRIEEPEENNIVRFKTGKVKV